MPDVVIDKPIAVRRRAAIIGVTISWSLAALFLALAIHFH